MPVRHLFCPAARGDAEEMDSDPGPAAVPAGLGLRGLHACHGALEVCCEDNGLNQK